MPIYVYIYVLLCVCACMHSAVQHRDRGILLYIQYTHIPHMHTLACRRHAILFFLFDFLLIVKVSACAWQLLNIFDINATVYGRILFLCAVCVCEYEKAFVFFLPESKETYNDGFRLKSFFMLHVCGWAGVCRMMFFLLFHILLLLYVPCPHFPCDA